MQSYTFKKVNNILKGYLKVMFCAVFSARKPILVLTMGKVASTSVSESLKVKVKKCGVYHIHFLSKKMLDDSSSYFESKKIPTPYHMAISSALNCINANKTSKIISLVREPISRIISDFFQNYEKYEPALFHENTTNFNSNVLKKITELINDYDVDENYETRWFEEEIVNNLGLHIYEERFNYFKGYKVYRGKKGFNQLIILRLEDLNNVFSDAMHDFLGFDDLDMIMNNAGDTKEYHEVYEYVKTNLVVPDDVIRKIYSTKYMRYFYSEKEINGFSDKWRKS